MPSPQAVLKRSRIANRGPRPIEAGDPFPTSAPSRQTPPAPGPAAEGVDEHAACDARIAATHADHVDIEVTCSCGQVILLRCDLADDNAPAPPATPTAVQAAPTDPSPSPAHDAAETIQPTQ